MSHSKNGVGVLSGCAGAMPCAEKYDYTADVKTAMEVLRKEGAAPKWGKEAGLERRNVFLGELKRVGVQDPSKIGVVSVRKAVAAPSQARSAGLWPNMADSHMGSSKRCAC